MPRPRTVVITSAAVALVLAAGAGGAYYVLHTRGTPQETAREFTQAWQRGDIAAMRARTAAPPASFASQYQALAKGLGVTRTAVRLDSVTPARDDTATAVYTATLTLGSAGTWSYQGSIPLTVHERHWRVKWSPQVVHPELDGTRRLGLATTWPQRGALTAADGERLDTGGHGGSVQQLTGFIDKATAKDVARLGPAYKAGDPVGRGGLQETFEKRLAGTPATHIRVLDAAGKPVKTLAKLGGKPGQSVRTSLDLRVQRAAASAVSSSGKVASLVAVRPSTGEILAVANNRGGFNRALEGRYPPGSTFKTITAAALLADGVKAGDTTTCPKYVTVGGMKIRNSEHAEYGSLPFSEAYAHSCNTTVAPMTQQRLSGDALKKMAETFGFNQPLNPGVPAQRGSFPTPTGDADLAASSFGQGRLLASPLVMASAAAAVADGTWRPPTLVRSLDQKAEPHELPGGVADQLRSMMRLVVTAGTAKSAGLPSGTAGKTGTAEFGTGEKLDTHAWFHGFRGDLAFAVIVENGEGGGKVAAPLAARFLRALG
ncbi:penicillin-binding transpeptidase domain-containing protein [Bailinhaonella thermotolerans]|uniref:Cell division protein FtsI n=1 Tax=Bailinhaonella thermotolerans TaxID=1070861 RepID=A0A3A4A2T2_9ACTN|nr:penicillin-binding transpeptidase domain-containing protein [Bailinhaonella thermotolerans]RJL23056.1 cell division protein FtsI [Bailinhaonella thermotolerans]